MRPAPGCRNEMVMRILVTGSNGLLGQKLLHTLNGETRQLIGIDLADKSFIKDVPHEYRRLDLTDRKALVEAVSGIKPQVIVHTAAMTADDKCEMEKELCWNINVTATDNVITAAKKVSARVIFISSDYIFDGKRDHTKKRTYLIRLIITVVRSWLQRTSCAAAVLTLRSSARSFFTVSASTLEPAS